jgi:hypothetical protein
MAALVLFQTATGLCCHRPCPADGKESLLEAAEAVSHCCHRGLSEQSEPSPEVPCEHDECLGFCTYLAPEQFQIDSAQLLLSLDIVISPSIQEGIFAPRLAMILSQESLQKCAPPVRLNLLHQILVV